ncbi:alpha/beta hydrolase fold domain-containing protein [Leucobacter japonicus]|uniref:alpha/beta hydrolase fold domain-containing protein n=1 Tax=Leucobacter japonicus TaxID=1461259 RepID=UPI000949A893|nr:alpha/beta hydrolase [Leucobacter japonicus]
MILPDAAVPLLLKALRANRPFVTAQGARDRIAERALRPPSYAPPQKLPHGMRVAVARSAGWPVYTVSPSTNARPGSPRAVIAYVHGGGWVNEISGFHWRLIAQLAHEVDVDVVVPIYPLVPFGTAADSHDGVVALVEQLHAEGRTLGLVGDSAGGQIGLSAALTLRDHGIPLTHTALISPALDLTWSNPRIPEVQPDDPWLGVPGGEVLAEAWRGELPLTDPIVSPLFGDFTGLGPVSVYSGTHDVLNPDAHVLIERLAAAGVPHTLHEVSGQVHVYPLLPTRVGAAARHDLVAELRAAFR